MTRGKVRLVATWWCMDCEEKGDAVSTQDKANREADRHMRETGHATVTNVRPEGR